MTVNLDQYHLNKIYNKFLLRLIAWDIYRTRGSIQNAEKQAELALTVIDLIDLEKLEQYQSHFPFVNALSLIREFLTEYTTNKDAFRKKKLAL